MDGISTTSGTAYCYPSKVWRGAGRPYLDGLTAVVLFFLAQLLICGLHHVTVWMNDFPAPIIAMLVVAVATTVLTWCVKGMDSFYQTYLRRPTDLLNRHMSIGFTVPFTMTLRGPPTTPGDVGLIIAGFLITGILNSVLVYAFARGLQGAMSPSRPIVKTPHSRPVVLDLRDPGRLLVKMRSRHCMSQASTLGNEPSVHDASDIEAEADAESGPDGIQAANQRHHRSSRTRPQKKSLQLLQAHPVLLISLLAILTVGLPVALTTGVDTPFDAALLVFLWTGLLAAQAATKDTPTLNRHPKLRDLLVTALNPVLWTSLGIMAYISAKAAVKRAPVADILTAFSSGTTLADQIHRPSFPSPPIPAPAMGAGDLAISILNAGLVSWGLKLSEHRTHLLSRAGLTTLAAGAVFALANVLGGPMLLRAMGLSSARALAFAARSVTLALAGPALKSLGGDVGLDAAMVVFSGIVFQMGMGLGAGQWAERVLGRRGDAEEGGTVEEGEEMVARGQTRATGEGSGDAERRADAEEPPQDGPREVATGVAVGINAAAMGTAYLYEDGSRAAPYAALSMTIFGVMTVVFTSIRPLSTWLVAHVS